MRPLALYVHTGSPRRAAGRGPLRCALVLLALAAAVPSAGCTNDAAPSAPEDGDEPTDFRTVDGIVAAMEEAAEAFSSIALLVDLTTAYGTPPTHEGQRLHALKLSDDVAEDEDEPAVLIVSAHHGNEIGGPGVALAAIDRRTGGWGRAPRIAAGVDENEIWIAPLWNPDGYPAFRKNGRPGGGVDLNRNYPFLWDTACSGSTDPSAGTYRGPAPASEPETVTMIAFSEDRRFSKVLDFHSSGRETLFGYRCTDHAQRAHLESEAEALSIASSYGGATRPPSAEGEHYQWQLGTYANYAFLTEIAETQTPSHASAVNEAERIWPGTLWLLEREIPVRGHVTDAQTGAPLEVQIRYLETPFAAGEQNRSEPRFGRFHAFLPPGDHTLRFEHPAYETLDVTVTAPFAEELDVRMTALSDDAPGG